MYKKMMMYAVTALAGIAAAMAVSAVFTVMTITGSGMEPALKDGTKVLINKLAYAKGTEAPSVGDVIAFRNDVYSEEGEGSIIVRRVAGSAGDTVEIKDNIFYLNGKPYDEYMKEPVHMEDMAKIRLRTGELFVLSDNRKSTMDSRNEAIGVLKIEDCIGKVMK